jgi:ferredoxin
VIGIDGVPVDLLLPHVLRERCTGCGICENKCPVGGQAAIRVHAPNETLTSTDSSLQLIRGFVSDDLF